MTIPSKTMSFLPLKALLPHLDSSRRIGLCLRIPKVKSMCQKLPLKLTTLYVNYGEVEIDSDTYEFKRLVTFEPLEETEFIQFSVNNTPTLIPTKASVEEAVQGFLEEVFGGKTVHVDTCAIGLCPFADINIHVEHIKFLGAYNEPVLKEMVSEYCLPMKSAEVVKWDSVPSFIEAEVLIAPINPDDFSPILNTTNYRLHLKSQPPQYRASASLVEHLVKGWEKNLNHVVQHLSLDVSTEFYKKFMKKVHRPGRFTMAIRNRKYTLTCRANAIMKLEVYTVRDESTPGPVVLHLKFAEINQ